MEAQLRIDKLLTAAQTKLQDEVSVLIGADFKLSSNQNQLVTKAGFFENCTGKQVVAALDITGEVEGSGALVVGIKDAIRLGGVLIMLPVSELDERVGREEYTEEVADSFGEIANIIAGSITKVFEEMYPKQCRLVRKEQQVVVPAKIEVAGEQPIVNQHYYVAQASISLAENELGFLHILLPAVPFGLVDENAVADDLSQTAASAEPESAAAPIEDPTPQAEPTQADAPPFDYEKHKKRIDAILDSCRKKLTSELSALTGADVQFTDMENRLVDKNGFFTKEVEGKQAVAEMNMVGDLQGKSAIVFPLKTAIRLGGVLIMLPASELEVVVNDEDFTGDVNDAFSEVANIASGVYTAVFDEQYTQKVRFIKTQIQQILPVDVDISSDEPIIDQQYYLSKMAISVAGLEMGSVSMLIPASLLLLDKADSAAAEKQAQNVQPPSAPPPKEPEQNQAKTTVPTRKPAGNTAGLNQQKKKVDLVLAECCKRMESEISSLLGATVSLTKLENRLMSKEEFFMQEATGRQVMATMDVVGDCDGKSYLFCSLKDAIYVGGVLIMLPPSELDLIVADGEFNSDTKDAYSEVTNIIAGVYTAVFEDQYPKKLRFVKTSLEQVSPAKVTIPGDAPIPDEPYYLSRMQLSIDGRELGAVQLLFPSELLDLHGLAADDGVADGVAVNDSSRQECTVLLISDDDHQAELISGILFAKGLVPRRIGYKDNVYNYLPGNIKVIYLIMREVNEQAFGLAIKVRAVCSLPVIAAGPGWTRSKVIKAVKYGISDILLTPASDRDIEENLSNTLVRLAA